jgi:glycosyltransferase involved in cell wall biosynthesis
MSTPNRKAKLALLTNTIAPNRLPLYSLLADEFDLFLMHGGEEANRNSWTNLQQALPNARVARAWGWQIRHRRRINGEVFDEQFIHITPGFISHLLRFQPDAIISNEMGFRSTVALAYGAVFRKPVWIWWGGTLHSERRIGPLRRVFRKALSSWAEYWISYGHTSTEYLLSLGVERCRILESQNAIDERRYQRSSQPAWQIQPRPVVLYTGQFIKRKGVGALLEASAKLQQSGSRFSLLLVGSGRDQCLLEERAQALGLKNVHFRSAQSPGEMASVYRSADVLVLPTLEDVWGLVANEAILSNLPVLCSKYAGCAAELFNPENVFAPDDLNDFCQKLRTAVSGKLSKTDPGRLKTTERLGREMVQEIKRGLQENRFQWTAKKTGHASNLRVQ